ncbi:VOC family protein [Pendulispora albinea]|uniref:Glyoxalase/bleomycin resistance/extradiol dioxygenase family protein n=1 Tax=Pendulispora albinea TaxID=2741071 RepID=A0ABZ2LYG3_9BACT
MAIKNLNPYVFFSGNAAEALKFYEKTLGAKVDGLMQFGDVKDAPGGPEDKHRVMHALVKLGDAAIMVSDVMPGQNASTVSNVEICLDFDTVEDLLQKFDALSAGGKVIMAPHDTFWGAKFGTLKDKFNIHWMFNCQVTDPNLRK